MSNEVKFAVIFRCKQTKYASGDIAVRAGALAWLVDSEGYWCGETFGEFPRKVDRQHIPSNAVTFPSREEAEKKWPPFMRGEEWCEIGPWWIKPDGYYEIVEIRQKFKQVPDGYEESK